jgi:hypothetical protein
VYWHTSAVCAAVLPCLHLGGSKLTCKHALCNRVTCKVDMPVYAPLQQSTAADAGAWHEALQLAQAQALQQLDAGRALLLVSQR